MLDRVTLFTQDGCPDSASVRSCLMRSGVPFTERNVSTHPGAIQRLFMTGVCTTPFVVAYGQAMVVMRRSDLARWLGFTCHCADGGE